MTRNGLLFLERFTLGLLTRRSIGPAVPAALQLGRHYVCVLCVEKLL
jgi:hypothetical protein